MSKIILVAAVTVALYRPDPDHPHDGTRGVRIDIRPGQPLPEDLTREERRELERLGAFTEELVVMEATVPAGGDIPGTNTSAADQGTDADVSGNGEASASPESEVTSADAPAPSEEEAAPPAGGKPEQKAGRTTTRR